MNRKYATGFAVLTAIFLASSANASDLFNGSAKDAPGEVVNYQAKPNWTGVYIGGRVGWGRDSHDLNVREYEDVDASCGVDGVVNDAGDGCVPSEPIAAQKEEPATCKKGQHTKPGWDGKESGCTGPGYHYKKGKKAKEASCTNGGILVEDTCIDATFVDASTIAKNIFSETLEDSDVFYGGVVGADIQRGRAVFGVFAYYDQGETSTDITAATTAGGLLGNYSLDHDGEWAVGARAGFLVSDRLLTYVSAAYKQVDVNVNGAAFPGLKNDLTFDGVEAGLGFEYLVADNVSFGVEATHFWGSEEDVFSSCAATGCAGGDTEISDELTQFKVMGTLKLRLNGGLLGN